MLKITTPQWEALAERARDQFRQRVVLHLRSRYPAHCSGRDDARLQRHVDALLAFAARHRVTKRGNVLRLIDLQARTGFGVGIGGYALYRLGQTTFDEDTRLRHFSQALRMPMPPEVIGLDTPLPSTEAARG
jgi:hypothetical protein